MNRKNSIFRIVVVFLFLGLVQGCATFKGNNLPEILNLQNESQAEQQTRLSYSFKSGSDVWSKQPSPPKVHAILKKEFLDVLEQSNYFNSLSESGTQQADLHIAIEILNTGNAALATVSGFISGYTLLIVPGWATDTYEVKATVSSSFYGTKEYLLEDSGTTVTWLPFIFVFPFKSPMSVMPEIRKNIYKNLLEQIEIDGYLKRRL